jgi:tungstate transport system substrate-binding protein
VLGRSACVALVLASLILSPAYARERLELATTTSVDNSGLLEVLLPPFEERFDVEVAVISVGTGKALKLAENGDVDLIIIHDPAAAERFVEQGFGINLRDFMFNYFLIAGPAEDPASVANAKNAVQAFRQIADCLASFISRGDSSGTHRRERALWSEAGTEPAGGWYHEVGQGMGASLLMANERSAYILTDQGTFYAYRTKVHRLKGLLTGDKTLYNPYSVVAVNPARWPEANYVLAMAFLGWITSPDGQRLIRDYRVAEKQLFWPLSGADQAETGPE